MDMNPLVATHPQGCAVDKVDAGAFAHAAPFYEEDEGDYHGSFKFCETVV